MILSFIRISKIAEETIIDELVAVAIVLFLVSSVFSYTSMRSRRKPEFYEKIADVIFLIGLVFMTLISLVIVFEVIR